MTEKRIFKRKHLIYFLKVMERVTDRLVGFMVDLTPEGVMIMSESPIEVEKICQFKILLPTDTNRKKYLTLDAKSKWCKKENSANFYDTGFELINISSDSSKKIENIIKRLCFSDDS